MYTYTELKIWLDDVGERFIFRRKQHISQLPSCPECFEIAFNLFFSLLSGRGGGFRSGTFYGSGPPWYKPFRSTSAAFNNAEIWAQRYFRFLAKNAALSKVIGKYTHIRQRIQVGKQRTCKRRLSQLVKKAEPPKQLANKPPQNFWEKSRSHPRHPRTK